MTSVVKGAVDQTFYFQIVDSTAGTPETAITLTDFDLTYTRNRAAAVKADATALTAATDAHSDNKVYYVDATNCPGLLRADFPDAAFASGSDSVILTVTATGCAPAMKEIRLTDFDPNDSSLAAFHRAVGSIILGTVTTGATATSIPTSSLVPSPTDTNQLVGRVLIFAGTTATTGLRGQPKFITAVSGTTLTLDSALTSVPASGDIFTIQ